MGNDLFRNIIIALSAMSVEFGALVTVFIIYSADRISSKIQNSEESESAEGLINTFHISRLTFIQITSIISTLILVASPTVSISALLVFSQYTAVVMMFELSTFALGTWIIIIALYVYYYHEFSIYRKYLHLFSADNT